MKNKNIQISPEFYRLAECHAAKKRMNTKAFIEKLIWESYEEKTEKRTEILKSFYEQKLINQTIGV